jgi:hypothetical protein
MAQSQRIFKEAIQVWLPIKTASKRRYPSILLCTKEGINRLGYWEKYKPTAIGACGAWCDQETGDVIDADFWMEIPKNPHWDKG